VHDVPTHLEVSDKLVFGLTAGQTLFCAAGVFVGYSLWRRLQLFGLPLLGSVPLATLASLVLISLTLIRPEERSLDQWSFILLRYLFQPKVCLLAREGPIVELEEKEDQERSNVACPNRSDNEDERSVPETLRERMSPLAP
jgi:PrgI family protein